MGKFTQTDTGARATLVNQAVTYTAVAWGTAGNSITVALLNTGVPSQALGISVVGSAISVNLALGAGVAASRAIQDLTYTADAVGTAGNSITVAYTSGGTAGAEVVTVVGSAISVQIQSGVSTATQVKAAVDASAPASALISAAVTGTGGNAQTTVGATALQNGAAPLITTTATSLVTALLLDAGVTALVTPSGAGASALTALAVTPLAGGDESDFTSITSNLILTQLDTGLYQLAIQSSYYALLGCNISVMAATASDLRPQLQSVDVVTTNTIVFRLIAGSTPTNMADGNALFVTLKLRNTSS